MTTRSKEELTAERKRNLSSLDRWTKKIKSFLDSKLIDYRIEAKEGWGLIVVFQFHNKEVFSNYFDSKTKKLKVFEYSKSYSCKSVKVSF